MLSVPAIFEKMQYRKAGMLNMVMAFTDVDDTLWVLSSAPLIIDLDIFTVSCQHIIQGINGISESFDPLTRSWEVGDVTVTLSNAPLRKEDAGASYIRIADIMQMIVDRPVAIYLVPKGIEMINESELLLRFKGYCATDIEYNEQVCTIRIMDESTHLVKLLPQTLAIEEHSATVDTTAFLPIIYGTFTQRYDQYSMGAGNGLARGPRIDRDVQPSYVFAHHVIKSIERPWILVSGQVLAYPRDWDLILSHRGVEFRKSMAEQMPGFVSMNAMFSLNRDVPFTEGNFNIGTSGQEIYITIPTTGCINPDAAIDGDPETYAMIYDNIRDTIIQPPYYGRAGMFAWGINHSSVIWSLLDRLKTSTNLDMPYDLWPRIWTETRIPDGWLGTGFPVLRHVCFGGIHTAQGFKIYRLSLGESWQFPYDATTSPQYTDDGYVIGGGWPVKRINHVNQGDRYPFCVIYECLAGSGNGIVNDEPLAAIADQRVRVTYPETEFPDHAWAACEGRIFNSWIQEAGRTSDYLYGDLIEDPAYIIESILRDELELSASQLDVASFDRAANPDVVARINITNATHSDTIIKQLAEQSTFAYVFTATGIARLISLIRDEETSAIIPLAHIVADSLAISRTTTIVNHLIVKSRFIPEFKTYTDTSVFENLESQEMFSQNNPRKATVQWQNINGDSAVYIGRHYIQPPMELWAKPHNILKLKTLGFMYAHLELGDFIALDRDSCDEHLLLYGESWYLHKFMITRIIQHLDHTEFEAIELFPGSPGQYIAAAKAGARDPLVQCALGHPISVTAFPATSFGSCGPESPEAPREIVPWPAIMYANAIHTETTAHKYITPFTATSFCRGINPQVQWSSSPVYVTPFRATMFAQSVNPEAYAPIPVIVRPFVATMFATALDPLVYVPYAFNRMLDVLTETIGLWRFHSDLTDATDYDHTLTGSNIAEGDYEYGYTIPDIKCCLNLAYWSETEYAYLPAIDADAFNPQGGSFSVEAIYKSSDATANAHMIVGKWDGNKMTNGWGLSLVSGQIQFRYGRDGFQVVTLTSTRTNLNDNDWHYIAITVNKSMQQIMLYVDGIRDEPATVSCADVTAAIRNDHPLEIGKITGYIDEVCFTNRVLSQYEIMARAEGADIVGNYALQFDALGEGWVSVLDHPDIACSDGNGVSISAWIKCVPADIGQLTASTLFAHFWVTLGWFYALHRDEDDDVCMHLMADDNVEQYTAYRSDIADDAWHHVVGVIDVIESEMRFYLDGVSIGTFDQACSISDTGSLLSIGALYTHSYLGVQYGGALDNVCLYKRALTIDDVLQLYNSGDGSCMPPVSGLSAYWRFDEGSGNIVYDKWSTHSGTLQGNEPPTFVEGHVTCVFE